MPIQPSGARGIRGRVEIHPEFVPGLQDLDGFSHIILLYHFHRSAGFEITVVPFLDDQKRGVFATRAPRRPNPIGLSVVKLLKAEGNLLDIENVDILDETPLLDLKPYVPEFEPAENVHVGWLSSAGKLAKRKKSDDRFR